jgi:hypothetical protein
MGVFFFPAISRTAGTAVPALVVRDGCGCDLVARRSSGQRTRPCGIVSLRLLKGRRGNGMSPWRAHEFSLRLAEPRRGSVPKPGVGPKDLPRDGPQKIESNPEGVLSSG